MQTILVGLTVALLLVPAAKVVQTKYFNKVSEVRWDF